MLAHSGAPHQTAARSVCRGQRPLWPRRRDFLSWRRVGKASGALIKYLQSRLGHTKGPAAAGR
jgi:hypothetical protein